MDRMGNNLFNEITLNQNDTYLCFLSQEACSSKYSHTSTYLAATAETRKVKRYYLDLEWWRTTWRGIAGK